MKSFGLDILRWSALAVAVTACGCGSNRPVCYPVHGSVQFRGKPVAEADVVFHPQDQPPSGTPRPIATTDENGDFSLTTFETGDGALVGRYTVTVQLRSPRQVGEEIVRDGPNTLPAPYAKPETSPLGYEVVQGENRVPPFEIR